MPDRLAIALALLLTPALSHAQFTDDFEDGDLSISPAWTGDLERWATVDTPEGKRLATRGLPDSDTLLLTTTATGPYGTWRVRYGYSGGPLSNFNHVRIVVWSTDAGDAGYYLLAGSNDRTVKLYRWSGDAATRQLLASAPSDLIGADAASMDILMEHAYPGEWRVWLDGNEVIETAREHSDRLDTGRFGLWVKHTTGRGSDHWFDDVSATPRIESDTTAPRLSRATIDSRRALTIGFTEPVTTASACRPETYELTGTRTEQAAILCPSSSSYTDTVRIVRSSPFPGGPSLLTARDIEDPSGNVTPLDSIRFDVAEVGEPPGPGDLVINEIDFAPSPAESEFVELLSTSTNRIDLSRVWIADDRTAVPVGPDPLLLEPGSYLVLARDQASLDSRFPGIPVIEVPGWPSLNNGGDTVSILHPPDTLDSVSYTPRSGAEGSLERVDPASPSDLPQNWLPSIAAGGATPGRVNSVYSPDVTPAELVFVEQTSPVALRAVFSEAVPATLRRADFDLNGDRPTILSPGQPRYSADYFLAFGTVGAGILRVTGVTDAAGHVTEATDSVVNLLPEPMTLVINEIMFEPRIDDLDGVADQAEYVEIRSLSTEPVALNSCTISGPPSESGEVETVPLRTAAHGLVAGGYAIIVDSRIGAGSTPFFAGIPPADVWPLVSGSLGLRNEGSRLTLTCAGESIDSARFDPAWHHPALVSSRGIALERISSQTPSEDPRSWTSSTDPSGGTPGRPNSVATPERKSEKAIDVHPSPFAPEDGGERGTTTISYALRSDRAFVRITIFNARGRAVRHLSRGSISPSAGSVIWDGRDDSGLYVPTGIYIVFLEATDSGGGTVERLKAPVVVARGFNRAGSRR